MEEYETDNLLWCILMEKFSGLKIDNSYKSELYKTAEKFIDNKIKELKGKKPIVRGKVDLIFLNLITDDFNKHAIDKDNKTYLNLKANNIETVKYFTQLRCECE